MRTLSPEVVETLVRNFSHGSGSHFDPAVAKGCQRESLENLGFGWFYFGLARVLDPKKVLVIGSGRGFAVACLALGMEQGTDAEVRFVDPGYESWSVDGKQDSADGMWQSAEQAARHFSTHLGLTNVKQFRLRSDEAFQRFRDEGVGF